MDPAGPVAVADARALARAGERPQFLRYRRVILREGVVSRGARRCAQSPSRTGSSAQRVWRVWRGSGARRGDTECHIPTSQPPCLRSYRLDSPDCVM